MNAALRLAHAEDATLAPAYLAAAPKRLQQDRAIPVEAAKAMPMLEVIEQRATAQGVSIDSRIERERSYRHALVRLLDRESFYRVVVPATAEAGAELSGKSPVLGSRGGIDGIATCRDTERWSQPDDPRSLHFVASCGLLFET